MWTWAVTGERGCTGRFLVDDRFDAGVTFRGPLSFSSVAFGPPVVSRSTISLTNTTRKLANIRALLRSVCETADSRSIGKSAL